MNKTAIRNFAIWARNKLINDVSYRAGLMGVTAEGISEPLPQSTDNVQFFDIGMTEPYQITGAEISQRKSLVEIIRNKEKDSDYKTAYTSVIEEVAYTWFNRLIAIRFMEVNDYLPSHIRVLSSESGKLEPDLVTTPFDAELFFTNDEEENVIALKNDNKLDEVFRMLFIKQCNALYAILPRLFENLSDYTELLLNVSFVDQDGVVFHLTHDIPEEDFNIEWGGQVEIIGWLYQYYNEERKVEVISINKSTVKKEDIPAATQLFTTDWVVRYIVDNSLGKYWVERHAESRLADSLEFFIIPKSGKLECVNETIFPEELKVFDPCMGSGHFLVYAFDVLMKIYEESGYSQRDAAKSIIENNIYGLDIDDRASQLAYFAVMMKARQYNRRILDGETKCNVRSIVESNGFDVNCLIKMTDLEPIARKLVDAFKDAKEYGTIIQVPLSIDELDSLDERLIVLDEASDYGSLLDVLYTSQLWEGLKPLIDQARIMVTKYHVVDTNPPYLNKFDGKLKNYLSGEYKDYSGDLFSVFMYRNFEFCTGNGYVGFMTPYVWMFIKQYEKLRKYIILQKNIDSLIQFEYSAFEEATVPICAFVLSNNKKIDGEYIKLSYFKGGMNVQRTYTKKALDENVDYRYRIGIDTFRDIPGMPIAFWISKAMLDVFREEKRAEQYGRLCLGMRTGDNDRFLRQWNEVCGQKINTSCTTKKEALESGKKWFPYNKGGEFRKWFGNQWLVVNWEKDGFEIKENTKRVYPQLGENLGWKISNEDKYFNKGIAWSRISSSYFGVRVCDSNMIFDTNAPMMFPENEELVLYIAGILTSKVASKFLELINSTISFQVGDVSNVPVILCDGVKDIVDNLVEQNINLSKSEWNDYEMSWDFKKHPLI